MFSLRYLYSNSFATLDPAVADDDSWGLRRRAAVAMLWSRVNNRGKKRWFVLHSGDVRVLDLFKTNPTRARVDFSERAISLLPSNLNLTHHNSQLYKSTCNVTYIHVTKL